MAGEHPLPRHVYLQWSPHSPMLGLHGSTLIQRIVGDPAGLEAWLSNLKHLESKDLGVGTWSVAWHSFASFITYGGPATDLPPFHGPEDPRTPKCTL